MRIQAQNRTTLISKPTFLPLVGALFFAILAAAGSLFGEEKVGGPVSELPTDTDIQSAVTNALFNDERTIAAELDVQVDSGVVTLKGFTENLPMKNYAVEIASTVKGVTSIVDRTVIKPIKRTDEQIKSDLVQYFELNYITRDAGVDPIVNDGVVRLTGEVGSFEMSALAEKAATSITGVRSVVNQLHVSPEKKREIQEIRQHLELKAKTDPWIEAKFVFLELQEDGKVHLSGAVDSVAERHRLIEMAHVNGVTGVVPDDLKVDPRLKLPDEKAAEPIRVDDAEIAESVEKALEIDPRVISDNLAISVMAGVVSMKGEVASLGAKKAAISNGQNTLGVTQVYDLLTIAPKNPVADDVIERNGAIILRSNSYLEGLEVGVNVKDGVATLNGSADTKFQRNLAENLASNFPGVKKVENKIRVEWKTPNDYREHLRKNSKPKTETTTASTSK